MPVKSIKNVPWEMLGLLALIIFAVVFSYVVGALSLRLYRKFKPLPTDDNAHLLLVAEEPRDSRSRVIFVGWLITLPLMYAFYSVLSWLDGGS